MTQTQERKHHVCPWWIGYLLLSPIRRWIQNPETILSPYVQPGMTVLDVGCAMGFFSLPLARLVGDHGKVVCIDLQERMLRTLRRRAQRAGLSDRIENRVCTSEKLGAEDFQGQIDLAVAFNVVHETSDPFRFLKDLAGLLSCEGKLLLAEPKGHVSSKDFSLTLKVAEKVGFQSMERPKIHKSRTALLKKGKF